jgi:type I restriction enzyme S subunit
MSEWKEYKLGELCEITSSRRIFLNEYVSYGVPFYRSKEIIEKAKGNEISTELFITLERFNEIKSKNNVPVENDILITSVGTLGVSYLVSKNDFFYFKDGNLTWLRNYTNHIYPKYLLHWLRSSIAKERFQEISIGSTQAALTIQGLKGIKIKIPEYSHQVNIAEILSSLDDKIELNNKINQELESIAELLFKRWFVDYEFPNENGEPYKSSGGEMVDSELGEMPKGWEVVQLSKVLTVKYGKDHKHLNDGKFPLYGSGGIMRFVEKPLYEKDSILIPRKGTLTNLFYVVEPFWSVDTMFYTEIHNPIYGKYLFHTIKGLDIASMNVGSAVPSLTTKILNDLKVINPTDDILFQFDNLITSIYVILNHNLKENGQLENLRDTILPKLISGELQINNN